jgi:predicted nuclease of predicted toxin-antitoxin system
MLRMLADENFSHNIVRGLIHRRPTIDVTSVQDAGLRGLDDEQILVWAAEHGRIVLTHDRSTMTDFAYARVAGNQAMPGVFVIEELLFVDACSDAEDWTGVVAFLPL